MGLHFSVGSVAGAAIGEVMARLQAAENAATVARTKADAADAAAAQAKADAAAAATRANNAMAKSNTVAAELSTTNTQLSTTAADLTTLSGLAANYQSQLGSSLADRAGMHAQIDSLIAAMATTNANATSLAAQVAALSSKAIIKQEKRVVTTSLLALGATVDLAVTWTTPFADANYLVIPLLDASTGVANVNPPALKSQTAAGCVVSVRANVAVAAGLAVNVVGLRFG